MMFRAILAAALAATAFWSKAHAEGRPKRVVSLNLCTDQLLVALADPEQILSLSPLVRDPNISSLADRASEFPINKGSGEAILFERADLVLAGSYGTRIRRDLLVRQGLDVVVLEPWSSVAHGREQIRQLAARLGHPERGERLIREIDDALHRSQNIVPDGRSILVLLRRGWVPNADSMLNELLRHMGFTLQQERLGLQRGGMARLENVVAMPPDYALMGEKADTAVDNGSALLIHPALLDALPPARRLYIPGRLIICGGPSTPTMIDMLAAEVRAKVR